MNMNHLTIHNEHLIDDKYYAKPTSRYTKITLCLQLKRCKILIYAKRLIDFQNNQQLVVYMQR